MASPLKKLTIRGFKSIENLEEFPLSSLNVMIGANGAGKTNFVDFFRLLRAMTNESLQKHINEHGGADGFFFLGPKYTRRISAHLEFDDIVYAFDLEPTANGDLQVGDQQLEYTCDRGKGGLRFSGVGHHESQLKARKEQFAEASSGPDLVSDVHSAVSDRRVYHFHDTSGLAPMRRDQSVRDRKELRTDASNLAAFLLAMRKDFAGTYALIRDTVRLIAPFFDDFLLEPHTKGEEELIRLEWRQKGSDFPFQPHHLSDGTIRFICLATALQQPQPPSTIVIDEPELGLHPYAINLLADLIQSASERTQVIVSTQSPTLLDHFAPDDVIVVNRRDGRSMFNRLDREDLVKWLCDYTVGELWQKNVFQGGPSHE